MDNNQYLTRAEVQEMINDALSQRTESRKPDAGGKLKDQPPIQRRASGWFDSVGESIGSAISRKVGVKDSFERFRINPREQEQPGQETPKPVPKPTGLAAGVKKIEGVATPGVEHETGGRSNEAVARKAAEAAWDKEMAKTDREQIGWVAPQATSNDSAVSQAIAQIMTSIEQRYISREAVIQMIEDAVPPQIRTMGCAPGLRQNVGQFLKIENSDSRTAVWGLCDASGGKMPNSGRVWVGNNSKIMINTSAAGATRFCKIKLDGSGYTWEAAMPDVQPSDGVVFDLDQTAGDIHIIGEFGG